MKRIQIPPGLFYELDLKLGLFDELEPLIEANRRERLRLERYWARRRANQRKALRIHSRLEAVRNFDPWKLTRHIKPNLWGEHTERMEATKALLNRKHRIIWVLNAMYHYWMFDVLVPGGKNYGRRYSSHRKLYWRYLAGADERRKQAKWDAKREAVRAKRNNSGLLDAEPINKVLKALKDAARDAGERTLNV